MQYRADPQKETQWKAEIESHREISPEELLAFFSPRVIRELDEYQQLLYDNNDMQTLVRSPIPQPESDTGVIASNNLQTYDDEVENLLEQDAIVAQLLEINKHQDATRALRTRRTVVAHFLFSCITSGNILA